MKRVEMEAVVRDGKITAKMLRKDGKVPAVVYGKETKTMPIEIKVKDIEKTVIITARTCIACRCGVISACWRSSH